MNVIHPDVLLRKPTHDTTDSYETHDFLCLKETKQLQKKKYLLYSDFNIIIANSSTYSFHFHMQVYFSNTLHHTPFVCVSIVSPLFCSNRTKNFTVFTFVYRQGQNHCAPKQQWRCTVLQCVNPTHRRQ